MTNETLAEKRREAVVTLGDFIALAYRANLSPAELTPADVSLEDIKENPTKYAVGKIDLEHPQTESALNNPTLLDPGMYDHVKGQERLHHIKKSVEHMYTPGDNAPPIPLHSNQFYELANAVAGDIGIKVRDSELFNLLLQYPSDTPLGDGSKALYWSFINALKRWEHPARFDVLIAQAARLNEKEHAGLPVLDSFHTAAYRDFSAARVLNSGNHALTYLFDGSHFGIEDQILVRTGSPSSDLPPIVKAVEEIQEGNLSENFGRVLVGHFVTHQLRYVDNYVGFQTRRLTSEQAASIDAKLDLTKDYQALRNLHERLGNRDRVRDLLISVAESARKANPNYGG